MIQLTTRWGRDFDNGHILQEYPRPELVRDSYLNLNGEWDYCISRSRTPGSYDGKIRVPFSPETKLSGVGRMVMPWDYLHYRKRFRLPEGFMKKRVLLHFGAVDQECEVYVNGILAGTHKGGYLPFRFDITDCLKDGENELRLLVTDGTEKTPHARGKQKLERKGKYKFLFYTPQSGIWKTVWLESVEDCYVERIRMTPSLDESCVRVCVELNADAGKETGGSGAPPPAGTQAAGNAGPATQRYTVSGSLSPKEAGGSGSNGNSQRRYVICRSQKEPERQVRITVSEKGRTVKQVTADPGQEAVIRIADVHPWTPDDPHLYDLTVEAGRDRVTSYFGMRKISVGRDEKGILRFFLNNKPFFFNGLLDQGYWPESLLTPPCDEALVYDIAKLKELGYNTIRKHIKIEPERFYYHCDRLGMIVWQDMPNGGGDYDMGFVTDKPNASDQFARSVKDGSEQYGQLGRDDAEGRRQYYEDLSGMVSLLYNHPCIAAWVPFNEGWGQFDAQKATALIRRLDPTRLVNEACGWFDQRGGDIYSIHNYSKGLVVKPQKDRVVALTEFGGYACPVESHMTGEACGYQNYGTKEELTASYRRLWEEEIYPNLANGLSAAIYTQTSDVEDEVNGLMTYDREVDKFDEDELRSLNQKLYQMFQNVTCRGPHTSSPAR